MPHFLAILKQRKHLLFFAILVAFAVPLMVLAVGAPPITGGGPLTGLVPCHPVYDEALGKTVNVCSFCDLFKLIQNILNFIFLDVALPLAAVLFVLGGLFLILGGANPAMLQRGKMVMTGAVAGLIVILLAWAVINLVINALAEEGTFPWPWNEVQCAAAPAEPAPEPEPVPECLGPVPEEGIVLPVDPTCSDGCDNDGDGLVDGDDPGCPQV